MGLADRIAVMHQGVIEQIDEPARIYAKPASLFVGGFVGSPPMNFLSVTGEAGRIGLQGFEMPVRNNGALWLGFRGEDVRLVPVDQGIAFEVSVVEPMGSHLLLTGLVNGQRVRVVAPSDSQIARGAKLGLTLDPARVVVMDAQTGRAVEEGVA
jgi:multiple sugar transport system ATP-binding protein